MSINIDVTLAVVRLCALYLCIISVSILSGIICKNVAQVGQFPYRFFKHIFAMQKTHNIAATRRGMFL